MSDALNLSIEKSDNHGASPQCHPQNSADEDCTSGTAAVKSSPRLIRHLCESLRDPSIVPSFEFHMERSETNALTRPFWELFPAGRGYSSGLSKHEPIGRDNEAMKADTVGQNDIKCSANENANDGSESKDHVLNFNAIPERSYLDLRIEQNKSFADGQLILLQNSLAELRKTLQSAVAPTSRGDTVQNALRRNRIKQLDIAEACINEGLAGCPNHDGLLEGRRELEKLLGRGQADEQNRDNHGDGREEGLVKPTTSEPDANATDGVVKRKGAESRAEAAMRDALAERSFLNNENGGHAVQDNPYPLLTANTDDGLQTDEKGESEIPRGDSLSSSECSRRDRRRHKKERRRERRRRDKKRKEERRERSRRSNEKRRKKRDRRRYESDDSSTEHSGSDNSHHKSNRGEGKKVEDKRIAIGSQNGSESGRSRDRNDGYKSSNRTGKDTRHYNRDRSERKRKRKRRARSLSSSSDETM